MASNPDRVRDVLWLIRIQLAAEQVVSNRLRSRIAWLGDLVGRLCRQLIIAVIDTSARRNLGG